MNNKALIIGGLGVAAVVAFLIYSKKNGSEDLEKKLAESKEEPTTEQEKNDVDEANKLLDEAAALDNTPEGKSKAKKIADKLAKIAKRTPLAAVVRAQIAVVKKMSGISKQAAKSISKGVDKLQEKGQIRRECRKEADDKFGFPISPKKIKEKADFRKKCKQEGGNDNFAFNFTSDSISDENEIFAFNGHTF